MRAPSFVQALLVSTLFAVAGCDNPVDDVDSEDSALQAGSITKLTDKEEVTLWVLQDLRVEYARHGGQEVYGHQNLGWVDAYRYPLPPGVRPGYAHDLAPEAAKAFIRQAIPNAVDVTLVDIVHSMHKEIIMDRSIAPLLAHLGTASSTPDADTTRLGEAIFEPIAIDDHGDGIFTGRYCDVYTAATATNGPDGFVHYVVLIDPYFGEMVVLAGGYAD